MPEQKGLFLWGAPPPLPDLGGFSPRSSKWWTQYSSSLRVSPVARRELATTSRNIAALLPDPLDWGGRPRPYKGLIVGAVQSGKTASMMGVAAVALDHGYRIIVVLGGAKDDLRQQTARRFNTQLLKQSDDIPEGGGATTLGTSRGGGPLGGFAPPYQLDANQYHLLQLRMQDALKKGEPCVIVVKKNVASLRDLHSALQHMYKTFGLAALPTLIFDDECDDASVDSTDTTIPAAIANLWRRPGAEAPLAAYLGYTATAAANLLQDPSNDLYPEHSAYLLRYPGEEDTTIQFSEPNPDLWYSGGDCYYRAFGDEPGEGSNFLMDASVEPGHLIAPVEDNPSLLAALRMFFVSGAYRLAADTERSFASPDAWPLPHTMLVQTSADTAEHGRWANGISGLCGGRVLGDRSIAFDADLLQASVDEHEDAWRMCYERIDKSRERVHAERPHSTVQRPVSWSQVKAKLREIFERTRLKVVNSDVALGTTLDYAPRISPSGEMLAPQDTYVIVVGGTKLSRGLTLEGLCVTYFVRWTEAPTEDTVLQMSRWFGYRGSYLEYCRVFTTGGIAESLRQMHENDVDLRFQLAELMAQRKSPREARLVFQSNPRAYPTGKMGTGVVIDLSYSPYTNVLRAVEIDALAESNEITAYQLVQAVASRDGKKVVTINGVQRGILSRGWPADDIATILDGFQFSAHNPSNDAVLLKDHYRSPASERTMISSLNPLEDPYQIGAYLRAWAAESTERGVTGPPLFNVGIAYGEMGTGTAPFDFPLINRQVTPEGRVVGGWTGRSLNWEGDVFFDQPPMAVRRAGTQQRLEGADGLLLLYIIHKDAVGRTGRGTKRQHHTPMIGISIPYGGPAFRRVIAKRHA